MPITTIIIISLLFLNLCLTLIMFWIIHDLLSTVKSLQDTEDVLKHALDLCGEQLPKHTEALKRVLDREERLNNAFESGVNALVKSYDEIHKSYDSMRKVFEERYSQSYDQFKHCSEKLKEISFQITDLANVSTEDEYTLTLMDACDTVCLDCPYKKCQTEVCPVYEIKHNNQPDIKFNEIPYDSSILMPDFNNVAERAAEILNQKQEAKLEETYEWTDDDYRDAVNTHPEDILEGTDDNE